MKYYHNKIMKLADKFATKLNENPDYFSNEDVSKDFPGFEE